MDEIVVTAQRRTESLNDVAIAITAFNSDMLESASVTELTDIAGLTPGLYLSSYTTLSPQIFIRGIGTSDNGITAEGAVGVYVDDVYVGRSSSAMFDLHDLERLEVLKGPQGTLYGRNTIGGAINIITKKPSDTFEGGARFSYGNYDAVQALGYVSGPLVEDKVFAKISSSYKTRDGWTTNEVDGSKVNDEDSLSIRGQLLFTPSDQLEAVVSLDYSRDRTTSSYKERVFGSFFGFAPVESPDLFSAAYDLTDAFVNRDIFGVSGKITWETDAVTLMSITGYRDTDISYTEDYDGTALPIVHLATSQDAQQFSQEFRAVSNSEGNFQWLGGVFYLNDQGHGDDLFDLGELFIGSPDEQTLADTGINSYAIYGEASYDVSDKLTATFGARYTYEEKDFSVRRYNPPASSAILGFESVSVPRVSTSDNFNNFSPKFVLDYHLNNDALLYAGITKGFKSGGFNNFPIDVATATTSFDEETLTSYEAGFKGTLADGRVQLNAAAFHYAYDDLQVLTNVTSGAISVPQIRNAAKAEVTGAEVEFSALLSENVQVGLTYGLLANAKYKDFGVFTGNRLPRSPKHTLSGFFDLGHELPSVNGVMNWRTDVTHSSKISFSPTASPILTQGDVTLVNMRFAFEHDSGWSAGLYAKNLTDQEYLGHVVNQLDFDLAGAEIGAPRQYGVSLGYTF